MTEMPLDPRLRGNVAAASLLVTAMLLHRHQRAAVVYRSPRSYTASFSIWSAAEDTEDLGLVSVGGSMKAPAEIIFEVTEAVEGGFDARALGYSIFTQGEDWADLKAMVKDAVICHFGDEGELKVVRLHCV